MTLADAFEAYLADMRARNLIESTIRDYRGLFRSRGDYAGNRGGPSSERWAKP